MNALLPKLNTLCFVIISVSLAIIAYHQLQPAYIETKDGQFVDVRSGKVFIKSGGRLVPAPLYKTTEES